MVLEGEGWEKEDNISDRGAGSIGLQDDPLTLTRRSAKVRVEAVLSAFWCAVQP
jgi:hypothetical protein